MAWEDLDEISRELLTRKSPPPHVERRQTDDPARIADGVPPPKPPEEQDISGVDQFQKIYNMSKQVERLSKAVDRQFELKLKDFSIDSEKIHKKTTALLDAEERLFGTRTGVITYPMYRSCLAIMGKSMQDHAANANVSADDILAAVGGDLNNAFNPASILNNAIPKDGVIDFSKFAPLELPTIESEEEQQKNLVLKMIGLVLDTIDPTGLLKKGLQAAGADI